MKAGWNVLRKWRWTPLALLATGLAWSAPASSAETEAGAAAAKTADRCVSQLGKAKTAKPTRSAKAAKPVPAGQAAKAAKPAGAEAQPEPRQITGSHLKQRVVLRRFPETISPVEVFDRTQLERRGEATLSGFLSRQATFR